MTVYVIPHHFRSPVITTQFFQHFWEGYRCHLIPKHSGQSYKMDGGIMIILAALDIGNLAFSSVFCF